MQLISTENIAGLQDKPDFCSFNLELVRGSIPNKKNGRDRTFNFIDGQMLYRIVVRCVKLDIILSLFQRVAMLIYSVVFVIFINGMEAQTGILND